MISLVIVEHDNQNIKPATLSAITAAAQCAPEVHLLVLGANTGSVAASAAQIVGVSQVIRIDSEGLAHDLAENSVAQIAPLAANYSHIVFAASSTGKSIAPRLAAKLDMAPISEVTKVVSPDTFERFIYAGNAVATVQSTDAIKVITVRATAFDAAVQSSAGAAPIKELAAATASVAGKTTWLGCAVASNSRPDLAAAKVVVSGGRALGSQEKFNALLMPLADKLGAAIGASRAAVDAGYAPNDWQVGQTGKIVAPQLYITVGISGAIQHLAGMKDSKVIVAINKDPDAPIFSVADYGLVADLFDVVPELTAAL